MATPHLVRVFMNCLVLITPAEDVYAIEYPPELADLLVNGSILSDSADEVEIPPATEPGLYFVHLEEYSVFAGGGIEGPEEFSLLIKLAEPKPLPVFRHIGLEMSVKTPHRIKPGHLFDDFGDPSKI